ncbi:type II toxin-antitoxin system HicB family antitoxin [Candidatus Enterococcus murrayae]|uniref:Type II toxin-antitoxin system HicB family antitoxin n=1 Tax=Candidatus Enterococcus murrayae TaxID=2815321 RepID=A0ABS3HK02_9ENTE|nr:type II toxin-antitoxin system HicB family antitoxin [Enterococcus sp. MJM16]
MKKSFPAIFTKEDTGFAVVFPDFSGGTQGDNLEEAMTNAKEFLDGILAYYIDEDLTLPEPADIKKIPKTAEDQFVSFIQGDPAPYVKKKTVRKNVTIPEWLAARGEKDQVNFSKILTDALFEKYG